MTDRIEALTTFYGDEPIVSEWLEVKQEWQNQFGHATLDPDWMHTDPERAAAEGPFGGTIAYGFWTMSMLSHFMRQQVPGEWPEGVRFGFNYGFDKVRLIAPVPVGSRIRAHMQLVDITDKGDDRYVVKTRNRIELEGSDTPAMIAEWLFMLVYEPSP